MCRYDDDYDWYVDSEDGAHVEPSDIGCEDCGRTIPAEEPHTLFVSTDADPDGARWVFAALWPDPDRLTQLTSVVEGEPFIVVDEDDCDVWEALGFEVVEDEDPRYTPAIEYHHSCSQCRVANLWLQEICDQYVVLVTCQDLIQHTDEYDAATLGPDFMTLATLAGQRWRTRDFGTIIQPHVIRSLSERAVEHAIAVGLQT